MDEQIELVYNHEKRRLTIIQSGRIVGGYMGSIATAMIGKIAYKNAKITFENGQVYVGVQ